MRISRVFLEDETICTKYCSSPQAMQLAVEETNQPASCGCWLMCGPGLRMKTGNARVDGHAGVVAGTAMLRGVFYRPFRVFIWLLFQKQFPRLAPRAAFYGRFAPRWSSPRADRIAAAPGGARASAPPNIAPTFGLRTAALAAAAEWVQIEAGWRESNLDAVQRRAHSADAKPGRGWRHRC